jgi:hypothetical protein
MLVEQKMPTLAYDPNYLFRLTSSRIDEDLCVSPPSTSTIFIISDLLRYAVKHFKEIEESKELDTATPVVTPFPYHLSLQKLIEKLEGFSTMELNWDSYGADTISPKVISNIKQLLPKIFDYFERQRVIFNRFSLVPSCDGGIQLEIGINNREIEIEKKPSSEYYGLLLIEKKNGEYLYEEEDTNENQILEKLSWLIE